MLFLKNILKKIDRNWWKWLLWLLVCLLTLLILQIPLSIYQYHASWEVAAQIGDSFGLLSSLFSFITMVLLIYTYKLQKEENKRQSALFKDQTMPILYFLNSPWRNEDTEDEYQMEMRFEVLNKPLYIVKILINELENEASPFYYIDPKSRIQRSGKIHKVGIWKENTDTKNFRIRIKKYTKGRSRIDFDLRVIYRSTFGEYYEIHSEYRVHEGQLRTGFPKSLGKNWIFTVSEDWRA